MNQLVRENLYYGENNSANSTYTYAYDSYGNMLGKYRYAYTTGSIANKLGITVAEYQYTDSQWGDLLTAVTDGTVSTVSKQNSTVSYDEMGNPTRYFGAAMTWAGKQLKYWGKSGKYVNFAYNEDGIRTQKNSNGILTNYYYNGSLLIGMTVGSGSSTRILRFSYDSSGSVVAVDYSTDNGTTFNTYYYLRNAQNDIVKLIDSSGSTVVEYCYDSWGKLLSISGSLASTLGKNNPFRYRGYVYDEETGFYYLQSRYYNPEVGRFISADVLLSTGQGVIGHNAYAYCLNNPVNMSDGCGCMAELVMPNNMLAGAGCWSLSSLFGIIGVGTVACATVAVVSTATETAVPANPAIDIDSTWEWCKEKAKRILETIDQKIKEAQPLPKYRSNGELHHIVAKRAPQAAPAREVLESVGIKTSDPLNLILLRTEAHRRLHTQVYYNWVNSVLIAANVGESFEQRQANVQWALRVLGGCLAPFALEP